MVRSETQVTKELMAGALKLRIVARAGIGVDNIDLEEATGRVVVLRVRTDGADASETAALLRPLLEDARRGR